MKSMNNWEMIEFMLKKLLGSQTCHLADEVAFVEIDIAPMLLHF